MQGISFGLRRIALPEVGAPGVALDGQDTRSEKVSHAQHHVAQVAGRGYRAALAVLVRGDEHRFKPFRVSPQRRTSMATGLRSTILRKVSVLRQNAV